METTKAKEGWASPEEYNAFLETLELEGIRLTEADLSAPDPYPGGRLEAEVETKNAKFERTKSGFVAVQTFDFAARREGGGTTVVRVNARYSVRYRTEAAITEALFGPFSELNLPVQTWPYFREFVQSSLARMHWPQLSLPILFSEQRFGIVDFSEQ